MDLSFHAATRPKDWPLSWIWTDTSDARLLLVDVSKEVLLEMISSNASAEYAPVNYEASMMTRNPIESTNKLRGVGIIKRGRTRRPWISLGEIGVSLTSSRRVRS